jgi:integrase
MSHVVYFLKKPKPGVYKAFQLIKRTVNEAGERTHETIKSDEVINGLNQALKSGSIELSEAELQARQHCSKLNELLKKKRQGSYIASEANLKLLKKYWDEAYSYRQNVDPQSAWNRLRRAVEALGTMSLLGPKNEIQKQLVKFCRGKPNRQRDIASALNQLRQFFGIHEKLIREKKVAPQFDYLTEQEFHKVLKHIEDPTLALTYEVLFYTGTREGEAFALENYKNGALQVFFQIDRDGVKRETKNRKRRVTFVPENGRAAVQKWIKTEPKEIVGRKTLLTIWQEAVTKVFPNKHITVHDLRHSYAVHMLTKEDASISLIAKYIGDSVVVCEEYYLGFTFEDDAVSALLARKQARSQ